ncbi:MAG TPA: hypothetical protein VJN94_11455 [Candidatus Binataceae bacterium]|nr:hypothetical protein [Candidatus Binataceae bacterium]
MNLYLTFRRAVAFATVLMLGFGTSAFAGLFPFLQGGPLESWSSCSSTLCIDAPPQGPQGLDGSGGWGWNSVTNSPVTTLIVGTAAGFTVTVLQPGSSQACTAGTITLTYSSQDFSLSSTSSRGATSSNPFDRGGVAVFSYDSDFFCHPDQSDSYSFTPQNPTKNAFVTATVDVGGQQVSETFPVSIKKGR